MTPAEAISVTLKSTGVNAAAAKRSREFSRAISAAAAEMKIK